MAMFLLRSCLFSVLLVFLCHDIHLTTACKSGPKKPARPVAGTGSVLVMTGGFKRNNLLSYQSVLAVEAFFTNPNSTRKFCLLPELPSPRDTNTVDYVNNQLVVCGGDVSSGSKSCLVLTETDGWRELKPDSDGNTLEIRRKSHNSWISPAGLLMIGGPMSKDTTEFVPLEPGEERRRGFTLVYREQGTCAITFDDHFISTGGFENLNRVVKYTVTGSSIDLPNMKTGRQDHGCGWYQKGQDKILLVAGGEDSHYEALTSTEILIVGQNQWTEASPLPRVLNSVASAKIGNLIYMSGDDSVFDRDLMEREINHGIYVWENEVWREAGRKQVVGKNHGMTAVDEKFVTKHCQE